MMYLMEILPFGCGVLDNAHHTQPYTVVLSVISPKEITTFHLNQGKEENVVKSEKCGRGKGK